MSLLQDLIAQVKDKDPQSGADLDREFKALASRRQFGLNFERHRPEAVELPQRPIRKGDKVRVLPPRGETKTGDQRLWLVKDIHRDGASKKATLDLIGSREPETQTAPIVDLVVVAEFRDIIYPGLLSTGRVERGGDKPFHTVINAENYHALRTLSFTHRGKVDAIYIDPPYNTGARDWKYNNDYVEGEDLYRHSKWLAMMERRLLLARELLNPADSVLLVTIDEKECLRLGLLLEQAFPDARIQMISTSINPAAQARAGSFARIDEYVFVVMLGTAAPVRLALNREWVSSKGRTHTGNARWDLLWRSGTAARRKDSPGGFYPIYVDERTQSIAKVGEPLSADNSAAPALAKSLTPVLPIRKDESEGRWQVSPNTLREYIKHGRVRIGGSRQKGYVVYYLKPAEWKKVLSGEYASEGIGADGAVVLAGNQTSDSEVVALPSTQWRIAAHDATQYGSRLLLSMIPGRKFPFPKSLYAVEDVLRFFVKEKPESIVLDFFSGSGTSAHAVMRLNRQDGGRRQCISVTNNEVAADEQVALRKEDLRPGDTDWEKLGICDYITKPRVQAAITGNTPSGVPIKGTYKFIDEFPMADGLDENAEFFTLTYETPIAVTNNLAFAHIAPLLWLRAGAKGRRIHKLPPAGWDVVDCYGLLVDLDQAGPFIKAVAKADNLRVAYIVTDDERRFQSIVRRVPSKVEPVRLYESYLTNFSFGSGE